MFELYFDSVELIEVVVKKVEQDGIEVWFKLDVVELLGVDVECYEKVIDILDVWFDFGVTYFLVLE